MCHYITVHSVVIGCLIDNATFVTPNRQRQRVLAIINNLLSMVLKVARVRSSSIFIYLSIANNSAMILDAFLIVALTLADVSSDNIIVGIMLVHA